MLIAVILADSDWFEEYFFFFQNIFIIVRFHQQIVSVMGVWMFHSSSTRFDKLMSYVVSVKSLSVQVYIPYLPHKHLEQV